MTEFELLSFEGIYHADLNFNEKTLKRIIEIIYELENDPDKIYSSEGRTFKLKNGFHSINILDKKFGLMEKYEELNLMVSRIQEILFTEFTDRNLFCTLKYSGEIFINEIWINILRIEDYNNPHTHTNCLLSGNFYLSVPKDISKTEGYKPGYLCWIGNDSKHLNCPFDMENRLHLTEPIINKGVIFQSDMRHQVLPHFSKEDRIGCAFNSSYVNNYTYDDLYPVPYWLPLKYNKIIKEENIIDDNTYHLKFKNGIELDIHHKDIRNFIGKDVYFDISELKKHRDKYSIDHNKYFNHITKKDDQLDSNKNKQNNFHDYIDFDINILLNSLEKGSLLTNEEGVHPVFLLDYEQIKDIITDAFLIYFKDSNIKGIVNKNGTSMDDNNGTILGLSITLVVLFLIFIIYLFYNYKK